MTCSQCQGIETLFNKRRATKELSRYRKKGPRKTTRILIRAVESGGVDGMSLLDIGGGIGAIQHELIKAGASGAIDVDASTAFIEAARDETERQGHADRVKYLYGDFVNLASDIPEADIVTLDKVICCYHDMVALVKLSSAKARRVYGLVFPRDTWWMRLANPFQNFFLWILRTPFRVYIHRTDAVDAAVRVSGLERKFYRRTSLWQVVVYVRK